MKASTTTEPLSKTARVDAELAALRVAVAALTIEVRELRQSRRLVDPAALEGLLAATASLFSTDPWTVAWLFEASLDSDPAAVRLRHALIACGGRTPSIPKLSRLLARSLGVHGPWRLALVDDHSRSGRLFCVTQSVTPSPGPRRDRVG